MGGLKEVGAFNREYSTLFEKYLENHHGEVREVDFRLATFVCMTTIEALTHTAVLHHADELADEAMDALVGEATCLITGYLGK